MKSETIGELAKALAKAQSEMRGAAKDGLNPHFKSHYATLNSTWDAIREPLTKNGLAIVQTTEAGEYGAVLATTLIHESGEWMRGDYPLKPAQDTPQGWGSALTYARRYSLQAIVGICADDDDANAATEHPRTAAKPAPARSTAQPHNAKTTVKHIEIDPNWTPAFVAMIKTLNAAKDAGCSTAELSPALPKGLKKFSEVPDDQCDEVTERLAIILDGKRAPSNLRTVATGGKLEGPQNTAELAARDAAA